MLLSGIGFKSVESAQSWLILVQTIILIVLWISDLVEELKEIVLLINDLFL